MLIEESRTESCLSTVAEAVRKVMSVETQFRINNDNESYPPLQTSPGYQMPSSGFQPNSSISEKFTESNFQPLQPLNCTPPSQRESDRRDDSSTPPPRQRLDSFTQDSSDLPPGGEHRKQASPSYSDCYTSDSSCAATPMKWEPTSPQGPTTPGGSAYSSLVPFSFHSPDKELEAAYIPKKDKNGVDLYFCHLCSFTGTSRDVFSAHMNTHFEHSCPHCDYTSRTEGRLKRHIKDFHGTSPPENYSGNKTAKMPGRPKVYRCKQCEFVATEKLDFWAHARTHIKEDKLLQCPKCPFVTEYKHHLEYHLRNHFGSKPFKCNKCNYACVNKSMLNSHMKSHTNVYQYRCADCTYATKYCHSLKLHLRKYNHKPATVLNSDGSLPQGLDAESAGLSLMMKRGPPRGPRGPRKDKLEAYLGQLMSMPPLGPRPALNGLISPYWPLLGQFPNGFHPPPPLIPMSTPGGPMLNTLPHQKPSGSVALMNQEPLTLKCTFCCFTTGDKDTLTGHMLKVHASENQDLFNAFGISSDSLLEDQRQRVPRMEREPEDCPADFSRKSAIVRPPSHPTESLSTTESLHIRTDTADEVTKSSPRSWPPMSSESQEKDGINSCKSMPELFYLNEVKTAMTSSGGANANGDTSDILRQMTLKFGGSVSPPVKESVKECPLDLTKPKMMMAASYYAATKRTHESMESSEAPAEPRPQVHCSNDAPSPSPRKRSRKGKAYKLDTISWKLQGMSSENDPTQQDDAVSTGSRDDADDMGDNSDHYSEKETEFSDLTPRNRGDLNTSEEKDDFADLKAGIPITSTPVCKDKTAAGKNGSMFGGRDLEQLHHSLKILNENEPDRKDSLHAEDRCPSPVSDLRRCSMGSNMGIPDLPTLGKSGRRSPSDFKDQQKSSYSQRNSNTPAAVRKGAEIAWRILHPDQQPSAAIPYQNGSVPQSYDCADMGMSVGPANHFPNLSTRLPPSQKLPAKLNGVNGAVPAGSVGRKNGRQGNEKYECSYCEIAFRDCVMYTMHMGYHGYQDPYKCNMCGHQSRDKVDFFLHIARAAHA